MPYLERQNFFGESTLFLDFKNLIDYINTIKEQRLGFVNFRANLFSILGHNQTNRLLNGHDKVKYMSLLQKY